MQQLDKQWPRRLLHVPTMCSHEWRPGNVYGSDKEPEYNAISYTWGRWQMPPGQGEALDITGVTWKIPAVDPAAFTVPQFHRALVTASISVDWLWVDIACIDQENPAVKALEIGRQAAIFHGANSTVIWLHATSRSSEPSLHSLLDFVGRFPRQIEMETEHGVVTTLGRSDEWIEEALGYLDILDKEPWFTSLWTLQEAYLSQKRDVIDRWAAPMASLEQVLQAFWHLETSLTHESGRIDSGLFQGATARLQRLALNAGTNPLTVYLAAGSRYATFPEDRVYGTMQIYGLQLGQSRVPERRFSAAELESEFAAAVCAKSPSWGQAFVHKRAPAAGRHWCIDQTCELPSELPSVLHELNTPISQCRIKLDAAGHPLFVGAAAPFAQLCEALSAASRQADRADCWGHRGQLVDGLRAVEAYNLDVCDFTEQHVSEDLRAIEATQHDKKQRLRGLLNQMPGEQVSVCILGTLLSPYYLEDDAEGAWGVDATLGLLTRRVVTDGGLGAWQRFGIIIWDEFRDTMVPEIAWENVTRRLD